MAAWKRKGGLGPFHERLVGRMVEKGYEREYAEAIFRQIQGFGEYGFPESHAASFALLVYASAWLKCHHPDAFLAALLNSQPMGFYAPAQLVRDARAHGVEVRPVDVMQSDWDTTLQVDETAAALPPGALGAPNAPNGPNAPNAVCPLRPVRLGLGRISGLAQEAGERIVVARGNGGNGCNGGNDGEGPFIDAEDLSRRARLDARDLGLLAAADALRALSGHRHQAAWAVAGIDTRATPLLRTTRTAEAQPAPDALRPPGDAASTLADYRAFGLTLGTHPVALLRTALSAFRVQPAAVLQHYPTGRLARASGIVTHRQRPETAKGVVFVTLEDDTGSVNVIVWPQVAEAQRRALLSSALLTVYGVWQRQGEIRHLVARQLVDHTPLLQRLMQDTAPGAAQGPVQRSRNFR